MLPHSLSHRTLLISSLALSVACSGGPSSTDDSNFGVGGAPITGTGAMAPGTGAAPTTAGTSTGGTMTGDTGGAGATGGGLLTGGTGGDLGTGGTTATGGTGGATATGGTGGTPGGMAGAPPTSWEEHWFEHVQNIKLVDYDDWAVIYVDDDVNRNEIGWMLEFFSEVWQYTVTHYGQFTDGSRDGRVYMIFHQGKYPGGHPGTYLWDRHDYRNVADQGPGSWADGSYDIPVHEISHIIEFASHGIDGSPARALWGDSKFAEIYIYDIFVALGKTAAAERVFDDFSNNGDGWFKDWFYPVWRDHGGVEVLAKFFKLLADHFPKNGSSYSRDLNWGEYVHFMSGAAGANLKDQATIAFGWPQERENQFTAAQAEFSAITY